MLVREIYEISKFGTETYRNLEGELHSLDGPARIYHDFNGEITCHEYYQNGLLNNKQGFPSRVFYNPYIKGSWSKMCEEFYSNGVLNNRNGPAVIQYDEDINIIKQLYFVDGVEYSEMVFNVLFQFSQ